MQGAGPPGKQGPMPAVQVVGFRVEGATPSPVMPSVLGGDTRPVGAGSPTPVIIPPAFQSNVARETFSPAFFKPQEEASSQSAIAASSVNTEVAPIRLQTAPQPIAQAERAEASHAGLMFPDESSAASDLASPVSTALSESTSVAAPSTQQLPTAPAPLPPTPQQPAATSGQQQQQPAGSRTPQQQRGPKDVPSPAPAAAHGDAAAKEGQKSQKEMTRAERRAVQEAQRAAKAASKDGGQPRKDAAGRESSSGGAGAGARSGAGAQSGGGAAGAATGGPKLESKASIKSTADKPAARAVDSERRAAGDAGAAGAAPAGDAAAGVVKVKKQQGPKVVSLNSAELFAHLPQYRKVSVTTLLSHKDAASMHPAVLQLGLRYADGSICGANARCMAMLHTFCQVIKDYTTPEGKSLSRDLTTQLNGIINFLVECRPLSVSMGNAIKLVKMRVSQIDPSTPESEAKASLISDLQEFVATRIIAADKELVKTAVHKVEPGDTILTFAYSHIVQLVLEEAARRGVAFKVVVLDSRPELEGRVMLQKLQQAGIACSYAQLNALSFVIRDVTKVFLGAAAVMSNGTVMGRAGNASVAMMAHAHSKPVMICCESYKFHERVQLDSITHNELGDPQVLATVAGRPDVNLLGGWQEAPRLALLNLKYDAMPADYVTMIVTEFGAIPPTSVPVLLRLIPVGQLA